MKIRPGSDGGSRRLGTWLLLVLTMEMSFAEAGAQIDETKDPLEQLLRESKSMARLSDMAVSAPMGRLILMRKNNMICAIRFEGARRGNDRQPPSSFTSGEESLFAQYRWFLLEEVADGHVKALKSGEGKVSKRAPVGIGRLATTFDDQSVACGPLRVLWAFPNRLAFVTESSSNDLRNDRELELAPTAALQVGDIDLKKTRWYRLDESRKQILVPLGELP